MNFMKIPVTNRDDHHIHRRCWKVRYLAAALAATAAMQGDFGRPSSSPGMPVRRPRRPAAASAAVAADAEPDLSCAVEDERTAKPPIGEVSSLSVGLSVSRWV